ncbi:proton extrusion protein PcxA [Prochlorothrix hollandica]|uniref:proton extrusion protein PcxA n=1 Tax=Prochlorothrix hollandica TaxID=1223 RepID=UPI003341C81E
MTTPVPRRFQRIFQRLVRWYAQTPTRALNQAYDAAICIQTLEQEHFGGQPVGSRNQPYSASIQDYFRGELNKYLRIIRVRLGEFHSSRAVLGLVDERMVGLEVPLASDRSRSEDELEASILLERLRVIDATLDRYRNRPPEKPPTDLVPLSPLAPRSSRLDPSVEARRNTLLPLGDSSDGAGEAGEGLIDRTSFVPRSILGTFDRLRRELDPKAEEEVVKTFRSSKTKTVVSLRFILILILVPLLVHQVSKSFLVGPFIDRVRAEQPAAIFLNMDMEEEALADLKLYEENLHFQNLIHAIEPLSPEEIEERVVLRAEEVAENYRFQSANALKNVFADGLSVVAFVVVMVRSKRDLAILKSFIDDVIYGLSDSAKAFIIILFTDVFVGFHSPHGWEVILEGISRHLGIAESRQFIYLFIATFPVILDTVFKYWIFRYLNRISPSAVATYRNMNE